MAQVQYYGTGRRKNSVARVRLVPGEGRIIINKRDIDDYFGLETLKLIVKQPLQLTDTLGQIRRSRQCTWRRNQRASGCDPSRHRQSALASGSGLPAGSEKSRIPHP